jgi:hypothetical protein
VSCGRLQRKCRSKASLLKIPAEGQIPTETSKGYSLTRENGEDSKKPNFFIYTSLPGSIYAKTLKKNRPYQYNA